MFTLMCDIFILCFVLFLFVACSGWNFNDMADAAAAVVVVAAAAVVIVAVVAAAAAVVVVVAAAALG
jgi:hypothetical protein